MVLRDYKKALQQARHELAKAVQQRDEAHLRIIKAQSLIRALCAMVEETESDLEKEVGIANAILAIVNGNSGKVSVEDVRNGLAFYGYDLSRYANPASLIKQTLERLADGNRIARTEDGKYRRSNAYEAMLNSI